MKRINNTIYADDGKVLLKGDILLGKEYNLNVTFFSANGIKLSTPVWEDESYLTEAYDIEELRAKKLAELDTYDKSDDINKVVVNDHEFIFDKATRSSMMNLAHAKIAAGDETMTLWYNDDYAVVPITVVEPLLYKWEIHAANIYNATALHHKMINSITDANILAAYDFTTGYPSPLEVTIDLTGITFNG